MRRREFITLLGGSAAWSVVARAQQPERVRRIGVLMAVPENGTDSLARVTALNKGLEKLGWTVGRNLQIDYRWGMFDVERARAAATDLLSSAPDVILVNGTAALTAAQQTTRTVPIVFTVVSEPLAQGFVKSLARPRGNITGFTNLEPTVGAKWVELLKEIAPGVTRVALMFNPEATPIAIPLSRSAEVAAKTFAIEPIVAPVHKPAEIETVMTMLAREPGGGIILPVDTFTTGHRKLIVELAARYRLPAVYGFRYFTAEGGLISYGIDVVDEFLQAAVYVDRILRGEKPADLAVQQPTKFELVINLKTAKALGLTVPPTLLARADEVTE
ncbi:ABC transporter substrate-binding protein [Bradyrhizobium sp.]